MRTVPAPAAEGRPRPSPTPTHSGTGATDTAGDPSPANLPITPDGSSACRTRNVDGQHRTCLHYPHSNAPNQAKAGFYLSSAWRLTDINK
jgi:hypothetical protein